MLLWGVFLQSLKDARHNLVGRVTLATAAEQPALRALYLAKFPDAYYVDFGDFK